MKTQRDVVLRETTVMQSAFTHIDSQLLDRSPKLKLLHKVRTLFVWVFVCLSHYFVLCVFLFFRCFSVASKAQ
jgi:hypothetical protein